MQCIALHCIVLHSIVLYCIVANQLIGFKVLAEYSPLQTGFFSQVNNQEDKWNS